VEEDDDDAMLGRDGTNADVPPTVAPVTSRTEHRILMMMDDLLLAVSFCKKEGTVQPVDDSTIIVCLVWGEIFDETSRRSSSWKLVVHRPRRISSMPTCHRYDDES